MYVPELIMITKEYCSIVVICHVKMVLRGLEESLNVV